MRQRRPRAEYDKVRPMKPQSRRTRPSPASAIAALATVGAIAVLATAVPATAIAAPWWMRGVQSNESDFLPPDVAFRVSSQVDGSNVHVRWVIADGYYLYRHKMDVKAESPDLILSPPSFPAGTQKTDPYLGTQEIFTQQVEATVAYSRLDAGAHPLQIKVTYQGCAEAGLCYPPISKVLFPGSNAPIVRSQPHPWEGYAIIGGALAFLLAGMLLRRGRKLDMPA
jgi:thiol:disulfide interchange protein